MTWPRAGTRARARTRAAGSLDGPARADGPAGRDGAAGPPSGYGDARAGEPTAGTPGQPAIPPAPAPASAGRARASVARALLVTAVSGLAFGLLTTRIGGRQAMPQIDEQIHRWVLAHRDGVSTAIARAVTWGGVTKVALPVLFVIGWVAAPGRGIRRRVATALAVGLIAGAGVMVETQVNRLTGRVRPPVADWAGAAGGPSFPSGHTTVATLFALSCAWLLVQRMRTGRRRWIWTAAVSYAVAVGWSRIWLGVHWPTDVLGAWLFGIAWSAAALALVLALRSRRAGSPTRGAPGVTTCEDMR